MVDVPSFAAGCTTTGASPSSRLVIPGATQPDWGPADVPAARPTPSPSPGTTPPSTTPPTQGHPKVRLIIAPARLKNALARGLVVTVRGFAHHARVRLVARAGRRKVAAGSGRTNGAGKAAIRLRFTAREARRLRSLHRVTLIVTGAKGSVRVTLRA